MLGPSAIEVPCLDPFRGSQSPACEAPSSEGPERCSKDSAPVGPVSQEVGEVEEGLLGGQQVVRQHSLGHQGRWPGRRSWSLTQGVVHPTQIGCHSAGLIDVVDVAIGEECDQLGRRWGHRAKSLRESSALLVGSPGRSRWSHMQCNTSGPQSKRHRRKRISSSASELYPGSALLVCPQHRLHGEGPTGGRRGRWKESS